ncbi:MAG TPA: ferredoxin--NADP reductase [Acidimicrobiales bacterium]
MPASTDRDAVRRAHGFHPLRVKRVVPETADTTSYVLDVPDDLRDVFRYRPGQFCTFRARVDGAEHLRCYSMSSAPETDDDLAVTVKRVPGGLVSNWLNDTVREGDILEVTPPAGVFCPREGDHPIVAFCGGSGVTPIMSIAKSVLASTGRRVRMLYANRDADSVIFDAELRRLAAAHPDRFELRHHVDTDGGYLTAADIATFAAASPGADFYVCGPEPFMDLVEGALRASGVDDDRILAERFVVVGDPAGADGAGAAADGDGAAGDGTAGAEATETVVIVLDGKETEVAYRAGDTLLETARRGGLQPPFSCEAGNCATCMALVREGAVTMRANNALTPEEVEEGWALTCQSLPRGRRVIVEYESF